MRAALLVLIPVLVSVGGSPGYDVREILREMETWVRPCVEPTPGGRVFIRCSDTHSSIHAHWAAYRIARADPTSSAAASLSEVALEYEKVRYETAFMNYPYAAAWFLRLAIEFERWSLERSRPDPQRLRPVADEMAAFLLDHYQTYPIDPHGSEYWNPSWALAQLHAYYRFSGAAAERTAVDDLIRSHFLFKIQGTTFKKDLNGQQFFSIFGNWNYLVLKTQPPEVVETFLALQPPAPAHHLTVNDINTAHSFGMGWSRTWAMRALSQQATTKKKRERFRRAADEHIRVGWERHQLLKGDFLSYDHWVPQFVVYAVTEGMGFD